MSNFLNRYKIVGKGCFRLGQMQDIVGKYDVIGVDEAQFVCCFVFVFGWSYGLYVV